MSKSSSKSSSTKRTRSSNTASMKQATLSFPKFKRTPSGTSANSTPKAKKGAPLRTKSAPVPAVEDIDSNSNNEGSAHEHTELIELEFSDDEEYVGVASRTSGAAIKGKSPTKSKKAPVIDIDLRAENPGKWNEAYADARAKAGNLPGIHTENEKKVHTILRAFDMSYEFGPCVGVPRIDRWNRAQSHGLNPPIEVWEILTTKQGLEDDEFKHSVLHGLV